MSFVKLEDIFHPLDFVGFNIKKMNFNLVRNLDPYKSDILYDFNILEVKKEEQKDRIIMLGVIEFTVMVKFDDEIMLEILIEGGFIMPTDIDEELFVDLLKREGAPILYDIIRYKVFELSMINQFQDKFLLPLIDFEAFFKKLEE